MKLLQAAFKITLFEVILIAAFAGLKYTLTTYNITDHIQKPFAWVVLGVLAILVLAFSIRSVMENRGKSFEEWSTKPQKSLKERFMAGFVRWGTAIPALLALAVFIYIITPSSVYSAIVFYLGIVIRNCITFFSKKTEQPTTGS